MGQITTNRASTARATLGISALALALALALFLLAFASPAQAADKHLFDPVLSLSESADPDSEDPVPDPGTVHPEPRFQRPCGSATDRFGDIYVSSPKLKAGVVSASRIDVFSPQGEFLMRTEVAGSAACSLAVDSEGNVYSGGTEGEQVITLEPSAFPPSTGTTYSVVKSFDPSAALTCPSRALAVDPSNDHFYLSGACRALEYGSAAEGSLLIRELPIELKETSEEKAPRLSGIDVYGKTQDVYVVGLRATLFGGSPLPSRVFVYDGGDGHLECEISGAEAADDLEFGLGTPIAVDQSNGDVYVYSIKQTAVYQFAAPEEGECDFIGRLPQPPLLEGAVPFGDVAVDAPLVKGEVGYGSPNEGHVFVTSGIASANSHLFAYMPVSSGGFSLTVNTAGPGSGTVQCAVNGGSAEACAAEYPEGTELTLLASADPGSKFAGWSEDCSGSSCELTMSAAHSVTATFDLEPVATEYPLSVAKTGSGTGKVTSTPAGIDCGSDCTEEYEEGEVVTLAATPDPGSTFSGFSGACTGTGTCEVTMSEAKSVTADFEEEAPPGGIALTLDTEGSGTVTSDKGAISCDPFCTDEYAEGTVVVLTATPNPGSVFMSWRYCDKGGVNGRQCTMTVDKAKQVKATFITTHALEVSKAPGSGLGKVQSSPGGILCLFNCPETTASFKEGTVLTLKQTPAKHFHFVQWLGDCTGSGACELTMGQDHEVSAKFAEDAKHLLTLTKSGGGQGTVKSSLAGINCGATCSQMAATYFQGEVLELTATPGKGSSFGGWSGAGCSGTGTCTVTVSEAKGVTAEFK